MLKRILTTLAALLVPFAAAAQEPADDKAANDWVRQQLLENGDDGTVPREVDHFAYPRRGKEEEAASIEVILDGLSDLGYDAGPSAVAGGVTFKQVVSVHGAEFDLITTSLRQFFASHGWEYDGWGSVVVNKEASP